MHNVKNLCQKLLHTLHMLHIMFLKHVYSGVILSTHRKYWVSCVTCVFSTKIMSSLTSSLYYTYLLYSYFTYKTHGKKSNSIWKVVKLAKEGGCIRGHINIGGEPCVLCVRGEV